MEENEMLVKVDFLNWGINVRIAATTLEQAKYYLYQRNLDTRHFMDRMIRDNPRKWTLRHLLETCAALLLMSDDNCERIQNCYPESDLWHENLKMREELLEILLVSDYTAYNSLRNESLVLNFNEEDE